MLKLIVNYIGLIILCIVNLNTSHVKVNLTEWHHKMDYF